MPAYSYKERFVPFVLDGSKPHTIRQRRKKGAAKVGDTLYHYFGMRTTLCKKLREEICIDVRTIKIYAKGAVFLCNRRLDDYKYGLFLNSKLLPLGKYLTEEEKNVLAWRDGFRPEGSTVDSPDGAFELMLRFWRHTHTLPFIGDIIYWDPK